MLCSGLGHVRRGNETWARDVAHAVFEAGTDLTLFGGGPQPEVSCPYVQVPNWPRDSFLRRLGISWHHRYLLEQISFAFNCRRRLTEDGYAVAQVADPALAWQLQKRRRPGLQVVYKDGLLLGPQWCSKFDRVQVLAPYYQEQAAAAGFDTTNWFVIPHLVDTRRFTPTADRAGLRGRLFGGRVPAGAFVVMAAGDYSPGSNKRLDWVLREFGQLTGPEAHLVVVGQSNPADFERFSRQAREAAGERVHLFTNASTAQMVELYQASDVFAHAALREPFGIVFLEAMACGLPIAAHHFEVTRWITGDAGECLDMSAPGGLAGVLRGWQADPALRQVISARAQRRARETFAPEKIVPLYQAMYARIARA
jgi:glycosyltransferase involved in cell wall biosynthesis